MMAPEPYQPVFSNGELSAPVGKVPHAIQATFLAAKQHTDAEALFNFLCDPANDLSELNGVHEVAVMLLSLHCQTSLMPMVLFIVLAGLGQVSPICVNCWLFMVKKLTWGVAHLFFCFWHQFA